MSTNNSGVGVNSSQMEDVCRNLRSHSGEIANLIEDLDALEKTLPSVWEGDDIELLNEQFNKFKSELLQLPDVIASIAAWGEDTTNDYLADEVRSSASINELFWR